MYRRTERLLPDSGIRWGGRNVRLDGHFDAPFVANMSTHWTQHSMRVCQLYVCIPVYHLLPAAGRVHAMLGISFCSSDIRGDTHRL